MNILYFVVILYIVLLIVVARTLFTLRRNVEDLRREKSKSISLMESLRAGVLLVDPQGHIDFVNKKAKYALGLKEHGDVKTINIYEENIPDNLYTLLKEEAEDIKRGGGKTFEAHFNKPQSMHFRVTRTYGGESGMKGGFGGTLYVLEDLTQERQLQEREKFVSEIKSDFLSVAAHQMRTPLSIIKWVFSMILEGDLGDITDKQREFLSKGLISNNQMIRLISDLLDVSRIENGKFGYKFAKARIADIIKETAGKFTARAKDKKIEIFFEQDIDLPEVDLDSSRIAMALENIIDNAIRYSPSNSDITIKAKRDKNAILVSVSDSGIGIPEHQKKNIFIRFFRAENAIRTQTEGSGLGLFVTKAIIEKHGGKIWFESKEGKGATFYFTIPI